MKRESENISNTVNAKIHHTILFQIEPWMDLCLSCCHLLTGWFISCVYIKPCTVAALQCPQYGCASVWEENKRRVEILLLWAHHTVFRVNAAHLLYQQARFQLHRNLTSESCFCGSLLCWLVNQSLNDCQMSFGVCQHEVDNVCWRLVKLRCSLNAGKAAYRITATGWIQVEM